MADTAGILAHVCNPGKIHENPDHPGEGFEGHETIEQMLRRLDREALESKARHDKKKIEAAAMADQHLLPDKYTFVGDAGACGGQGRAVWLWLLCMCVVFGHAS